MLKNKLSVVQSKYLTKKDTRIRIRIWIIKPGSGSWKKPGSTQIRIRHAGTNHHPAIFFSLHNAGGGGGCIGGAFKRFSPSSNIF